MQVPVRVDVDQCRAVGDLSQDPQRQPGAEQDREQPVPAGKRTGGSEQATPPARAAREPSPARMPTHAVLPPGILIPENSRLADARSWPGALLRRPPDAGPERRSTG